MEGKFQNGDGWTGHKYFEDGTWWFIAIDDQGREYETDEIPETEPLFTMMRFEDGTPEHEVYKQAEFMKASQKCPQCNWLNKNRELCTECGYVPELGYHVRMKPGRCANGFELGKGTRWHAIKPGQYKALCGTEPGRRTPGWSSWHNSVEVTCPTCKRKLERK